MLNIHPAVVHLPIGILTLYSLTEIIRVKKVLTQDFWRPLKGILVIAGFVGVVLALQSGELIEHAFADRGKVFEMHTFFATATAVVYGVAAASYLLRWIERVPVLQKYWDLLRRLGSFFQKPAILVMLAVLGFLCLTITGALGGAMVHGADADPLVGFVYSLFVQ